MAKGWKATQESRDRYSAARKKKWANPEYKAKMIEHLPGANKKRWDDPSSIEKIRARHPYSLKSIIARDGHKCRECGLLPEWNGKKLTLHRHHTADSVILLCPNCHTQTDNYAGSKGRWDLK